MQIPSINSDFDQYIADAEFQNIAKLLTNLEKSTGCGVLCSTSFNGRGEPIVETPDQAIDCFLRLGLDYLYLQGYLVWRPTTKASKV